MRKFKLISKNIFTTYIYLLFVVSGHVHAMVRDGSYHMVLQLKSECQALFQVPLPLSHLASPNGFYETRKTLIFN